MIGKFKRHLHTLLLSGKHIRTLSLIGFLFLAVAIPLTVYVVQQQQDIRQRAVGGGFSLITTNGCGSVLTKPADGANEGDITWKAPEYENGQWVSKRPDGSVADQAWMRQQYIGDPRNGDSEAQKALEWDTKVVSERHINCNTFIVFHGVDCDRTPVSGFVERLDEDGTTYKAVPAGETAVLHVAAGTDPQSPNCRYNFRVRKDINGGASPTPSATPSATPGVTATPSATPSVTGTPSATPTITILPTSIPTIPSTPTIFSLSVSLPGIGKNGNQNPNNARKDVLFQLFDSAKKQVGSDIIGSVTFDKESGKFLGIINMGTIVSTGNYSTKIKLNQFLARIIASNSAVTAGITNNLPPAIIITGDINNDNKLDILDYNILVSCFGSKSATDICSGKQVDADLNDDGVVDGIDYNLFLAGIKTAKQGD